MRLSRRNRQDAGATLVEFAIVLPLLLLLLFGLVEFARIVSEFTTVRTAAREGARFATTVDAASGTPNYADCSGIVAAAQSRAVVGNLESIEVVWSFPTGGTFSCSDTNDVDPTWTTEDAIPAGTEISVTVTSAFDSIVPIMEVFLDGIALDSTQTRQIFKGVIESD